MQDLDLMRRTVRVGMVDRAGSQSAQRAEDQAFDQDRAAPQVVADALSRHVAEFPPGDDGTLR